MIHYILAIATVAMCSICATIVLVSLFRKSKWERCSACDCFYNEAGEMLNRTDHAYHYAQTSNMLCPECAKVKSNLEQVTRDEVPQM